MERDAPAVLLEAATRLDLRGPGGDSGPLAPGRSGANARGRQGVVERSHDVRLQRALFRFHAAGLETSMTS
jgi:hypothetical protein